MGSDADFEFDTYLDPTIQYPHPIANNLSRPHKIFLTGATGLLGTNLLGEFLHNTHADIYCLVRSNHVGDGKARLKNQLQFYAIWKKAYESRIIPVIGDLEQPRFGLSDRQFRNIGNLMDVIFHCGANTNLLSPYRQLKAANVLSTREVLRLAGYYRTKPVHYISTLSVFEGQKKFNAKKRVIRETDNPTSDTTGKAGYTMTKMVSERLVQNAQVRGLPAYIYRVGRILGRSDNGIMGNVSDFVCMLWRASVLLGYFPIARKRLNFVPVDFASQAIGHLSRTPHSMGKILHITNQQSISWKDIFDATRSFGYLVNPVSLTQWLEAVSQHSRNNQDKTNNAIMEEPFWSYFAPRFFSFSQGPVFDAGQTFEDLLDASITCSPLDARLLNTYISYFEASGFFPPSPSPVVEYWRKRSEDTRKLTPSLQSNVVEYWRAKKRSTKKPPKNSGSEK